MLAGDGQASSTGQDIQDQSVSASFAPSGVVGATVSIENVGKRFSSKRGDVEAVRDVSMRIPSGHVVALLGPSGCGKSTVLRMVAGLLAPTRGTIEVGDQRVERTIRDLGMVFQTSSLLDWMSVAENVQLQGACRPIPRDALRERTAQLLGMVGLAGFEKRRPYELSGGMQQRVALCRALVHSPPLLLMDEPFGAVDALTRDQIAVDIQPLLRQSNATVILVTHSISEAVFLADTVYIFSPRPAEIAERVEVSFSRPRALDLKGHPEFAALVGRITKSFERMGVLG